MREADDTQSLADKAYDALVEALRVGQLRAGQFVSVPQLTVLLDAPTAPVRDAVKRAGEHGLLTALPKRGLQVMEAEATAIRGCLDLRRALDQEGARRRIAGKQLDGLGALREAHEGMRRAALAASSAGLPSKAIAVDLSLHDFLADGLGNSLLSAAYDVNRIRIAVIQKVRPFLQDRIVSAMDEHLAVIEAIAQGDADTAVAAIDHHYAQTLRWWGVS